MPNIYHSIAFARFPNAPIVTVAWKHAADNFNGFMDIGGTTR